MDGQVKDAPIVAAVPHKGTGLYNDLDMTPIVSSHKAQLAAGRPDDGIARPPYDPLSTGQKVSGILDAAGSLGGSYLAISKFERDGLHVLRADIQSLDKLVHTPELYEFRSLGASLNTKVGKLANAAQDDVLGLQSAKPHLFDTYSGRGVWKGVEMKTPKYDLMNSSEQALMQRSNNLNYLAKSLSRGVNTSNTANFKSGLTDLRNLDTNPVAVREGLAPELRQIENLGAQVNEQVAKSTLSMAAESRALLFKNAGIIGLGMATNAIIEKTFLKDSAPKGLTIATDCAAPFIVLSELPLWAKFTVIVGAHAAARLAEYGMSK